jgi:hypothetical protein
VVVTAQVRDLLGHASITTTERYDTQRWQALESAAKLLESGKTFDAPAGANAGGTFKKASSSLDEPGDSETAETAANAGNGFDDQELQFGWEAGIRTRITWSRGRFTRSGPVRSTSFPAVFLDGIPIRVVPFRCVPVQVVSMCLSRLNRSLSLRQLPPRRDHC